MVNRSRSGCFRIQWFASLLLAAATQYASVAHATIRDCNPNSIWEVAPRSFQIFCTNGGADGDGGIPSWIVLRPGGSTSSAEAEATASRFQALVMAIILAGQKLRVDAVTDSTLCAGITDCRRANFWGMIPY